LKRLPEVRANGKSPPRHTMTIIGGEGQEVLFLAAKKRKRRRT
jgi:hypothetical protein